MRRGGGRREEVGGQGAGEGGVRNRRVGTVTVLAS